MYKPSENFNFYLVILGITFDVECMDKYALTEVHLKIYQMYKIDAKDILTLIKKDKKNTKRNCKCKH